MSINKELRKQIKAETKQLFNENPWPLVLGELLVNAALASETYAVGIVLGGPLTMGQVDYELKVLRKEEKNVSDLFSGFKNGFGRNLLLFIIKFIYLFLWYLLFIIPGIIKSYSYKMSFFIAHDDPNIDPEDAITKSRRMMDGHKWELFLLHLSYLGWLILSVLTCGVLYILYVGPWMRLAEAKFYEQIKEEKEVQIEEEN